MRGNGAAFVNIQQQNTFVFIFLGNSFQSLYKCKGMWEAFAFGAATTVLHSFGDLICKYYCRPFCNIKALSLVTAVSMNAKQSSPVLRVLKAVITRSRLPAAASLYMSSRAGKVLSVLISMSMRQTLKRDVDGIFLQRNLFITE